MKVKRIDTHCELERNISFAGIQANLKPYPPAYNLVDYSGSAEREAKWML